MRRILTVFLFIIMITGLSAAVYANDVQIYVESGYDGNEHEFFAPSGSEKIKTLNFSVSDASSSGDGEKPYRRISHRILYTNTYVGYDPQSEDSPFSGSTALNIDYESYTHSLDDYSVLRFGVQIECSDNAPVSGYEMTAIFSTDEGDSYTSVFRIPSDSASLVSMDLRGISGNITYFSISADYTRETAPVMMKLSAPYLSRDEDQAFLTSDKYTAGRLTASVGMIASSVGRVRPSGGEAVISGDLLTPAVHETGTTSYLAVQLTGIESGGMSVGISFVGTTEEQRYYTKKIALADSSESVETVLFPIEMLDAVQSYTMYFSDIVCSNTFRIESIRFLEGPSVPFDGNYDIGTLSTLTRGHDYVYFEGSMERDAVRRFRGSSINFYAIPASTANDLTTAYLLGNVHVSTEFSYSADFSAMSGICDTFMFFAAVTETGKDGMHTLMPLSKPRYPDAQPLAESDVSSIIGLADAASVGVFEANVSNVSITVDLCDLISDSDSGTQISYIDHDSKAGTARRISLSDDLLASMDGEIRFYISSGTNVYLRLTASSPIKGLTYSGKGSSYMPDLSKPGARYYWAAIIHYLSERYSGISGYILGNGVNCADFVSYDAFMTDGVTDPEKLTSYAASIAELARITYTAASVYITGMPVTIPFSPAQTSETGIAAHHLALLLSDRFSQTGNIPWALQWNITALGLDAEDDFAEHTFMRHRLEEFEVRLPAAYTFTLEADSDALLLSYGEYVENQRALDQEFPEYSDYAAEICSSFYEKCRSYHARAAFVSLEGHSLKHNHTFYSAIKNIGTSGRFVHETETVSGASQAEHNYTLFDFSDKHYPLGWIAGGGVRSCLTESSRLFSQNGEGTARVLRTEFSDDLGFVDNTGSVTSGNAGIALRNLSRSYNFNDISSVEFTLALEQASEKPVTGAITVVMIIGNDDYRAEYYAQDVSAGEILTLTCDLTEYVYRNIVDYIGIMVYSDSPVYLDLSRVRVGSDTMTEDELRDMFDLTAEEEFVPDLKKAGFVLVLAAMLSIIIIIVLTHYDREEDEKREAALAEASKHRRIRR